MALDLRQLEWRVLELEKYGGSGGLTKAIADTLYLPIDWTPPPDLKDFQTYWSWTKNTKTPEVGDPITLRVGDPQPPTASLSGIHYFIQTSEYAHNHGEATVNGNVITTTAPGWINIFSRAPNGVGTGSGFPLYIAPVGKGNETPPYADPASAPPVDNNIYTVDIVDLPHKDGEYVLKIENGNPIWIPKA